MYHVVMYLPIFPPPPLFLCNIQHAGPSFQLAVLGINGNSRVTKLQLSWEQKIVQRLLCCTFLAFLTLPPIGKEASPGPLVNASKLVTRAAG